MNVFKALNLPETGEGLRILRNKLVELNPHYQDGCDKLGLRNADIDRGSVLDPRAGILNLSHPSEKLLQSLTAMPHLRVLDYPRDHRRRATHGVQLAHSAPSGFVVPTNEEPGFWITHHPDFPDAVLVLAEDEDLRNHPVAKYAKDLAALNPDWRVRSFSDAINMRLLVKDRVTPSPKPEDAAILEALVNGVLMESPIVPDRRVFPVSQTQFLVQMDEETAPLIPGLLFKGMRTSSLALYERAGSEIGIPFKYGFIIMNPDLKEVAPPVPGTTAYVIPGFIILFNDGYGPQNLI